MNLFHLIPILLLPAAQTLLAQMPVFLENPGFEDLPQYASVPGGWRSCAFNGESPPDIHPVENGRFGVDEAPAEGETYLGLVLRENGTTESVGQRLTEPLLAGQCYSFSIQLCHSDTLISMGRVSGRTVNFNEPAVLKVWGGVSPCGKKELLAASLPIKNLAWEKTTFLLQPTEDLRWVILEADFAALDGQAGDPANGNLLLDDASAFVPVDCDTQQPLVDLADFNLPHFTYRKIVVGVRNSEGFFAAQGNGRYLVNLRLAQTEETLAALLRQNCERIGFLPGSAEMDEPLGIGLKEMGANAEKFGRRLAVGIQSPESGLAKKRKRKVEKLFREIELPGQYFRIEILGDSPATDWQCGEGEIWMKLEG